MKGTRFNSANKNQSNLGMRNSGRKAGSKNRLSSNAKEVLYELLKDDLKRLDKLMNTQHYDERMMHLKHFSKILTTGNDKVATKSRELIFEGLQEHYKKMKFYFPHVPQEKKVGELRQFLKLLPIDNIEDVIQDMKKQNISFR